MFTTLLTVGGYVVVQLALTISFCSIIVYIWLRSENIRRSSLSYMPTPQTLAAIRIEAP
jgi:hypothetical protein